MPDGRKGIKIPKVKWIIPHKQVNDKDKSRRTAYVETIFCSAHSGVYTMHPQILVDIFYQLLDYIYIIILCCNM